MKDRKKIVVEISTTKETTLSKQSIYEVLTADDKRYIVDAELIVTELDNVYTDDGVVNFIMETFRDKPILDFFKSFILESLYDLKNYKDNH
jgi:hypothetical protein